MLCANSARLIAGAIFIPEGRALPRRPDDEWLM